MPTLIRTELLKLRTVRSPWLVLGAAPLVVAAGISGLVVSEGKSLTTARQSDALAHGGLASLPTPIFGHLAVGGEYRHKPITDAYLGPPRRGRVIVAKLVVYPLLGALTGVVAAAVGVFVAAVWWSGRGVAFDWSNTDMWVTIGGGIAWNAAFAAI